MATTAPPLHPQPALALPTRSFVFINDTNPEDAKSASKRKLVRAQAARGPHSNTHNTPWEEIKAHPQVVPSGPSQIKRNKKRNGKTVPLNVVGLGDLEHRPSRTVPAKAHESPPITVQGEEKTSGSEGRDSTLEVLVPRNPGTGWAAGPFISAPKSSRPYTPMLLAHYLDNMAVAIPELDAGQPMSLKYKWYPYILTAPSTVNIVLLTAASHYVVSNNLLGDHGMREVLLDLKGATLKSINKEIAHTPKGQPLSDTTIGAVAKMASYEATFGSSTLYHTHMQALQTIVMQRGGLTEMSAVLDGLLMRMILWVDMNAAAIFQSKTYFKTPFPLAGHVADWTPEPLLFHCSPQGFIEGN